MHVPSSFFKLEVTN